MVLDVSRVVSVLASISEDRPLAWRLVEQALGPNGELRLDYAPPASDLNLAEAQVSARTRLIDFAVARARRVASQPLSESMVRTAPALQRWALRHVGAACTPPRASCALRVFETLRVRRKYAAELKALVSHAREIHPGRCRPRRDARAHPSRCRPRDVRLGVSTAPFRTGRIRVRSGL